MSKNNKITAFFSKPALLHYVLPLIILYLIIGTLAQKYIGLYDATKMFFASPILWIDIIPLPGFPLLIALIFLNLTFKLIYKSRWTNKSAGIIITHIGAMLLLLGGLFTALFSSEGYMDLSPGQRKSSVSDYHTRELRITDEAGHIVKSLPHTNLKPHQTISIQNVPEIKILETCRNCTITARENATERHIGMAAHMQLSDGSLKKNDEENLAGLTVQIGDEIHTILEDIPKTPEINGYRFALGREKRELPFDIELIKFKRETHPGTELAKAYESRIRIYDGDTQWESTISMNAPLRYKGYTFFQSSFAQNTAGEDISVLAVVWNVGRAFPYIAGLLMCLGMIMHLIMRRA